MGFPCGSGGKESTCSGETWVWSLGWADPLKKGKATTPVFQPWEFHGVYSPWGYKDLDMTERLSLHFSTFIAVQNI